MANKRVSAGAHQNRAATAKRRAVPTTLPLVSARRAPSCRHFQRDLYAATELLTDPARLKAAVMELHRRHGGGPGAAGKGAQDEGGAQPAVGGPPSDGAASATAPEAKCAPSACGCHS